MNAVEIEEAVSALAEASFDAAEFPYAFLAAFGNKQTTIERLRKGATNKSDVASGMLQRNNIHLAVAPAGAVGDTLKKLVASPATAKQKAKFALATDGQTIEAENLGTGETLACDYAELGDHFGFFLELAGITTVKAIRENAFDIKATGRLNRLYVELLTHNPEWDRAEKRETLNHFFARLIFCFFAEDTGIFAKSRDEGQFTSTVQQMTESNGSNTAWVLSEIFRAMDVPIADRPSADLRNWTDAFPYVNGGLFAGAGEGEQVPTFTKIARSYLLHVGGLDWTKINPDIFGSMIQAVADDEERGALGLHYTSVPNILKVLNPLFLDDLRAKLEEAGDSKVKLLNLRRRLARIRVFDPACGSGNFLVIAYKHMREFEAEINRRRGEAERATEIPLTNFRGIELRHFAAEVARLALIIAEYQCDVLHRGPKLALAEFLPLSAENWITHGNALRIDWLKVCPPTGTEAKLHADDLYSTPLDQAEMDFQNEGGETYICGNPPYSGDKKQTKAQKEDIKFILEPKTTKWRSLDYVTAWFVKAAEYGRSTSGDAAFVSTNSIGQGQQVPILWPIIFKLDHEITFAHTGLKWTNLASNNAGVIVVIVGISKRRKREKTIFSVGEDGNSVASVVSNINGYFAPGPSIFVQPRSQPLSDVSPMLLGNFAKDGGHLICERNDFSRLDAHTRQFLRPMFGGSEFIKGVSRYCFWIAEEQLDEARRSDELAGRFERVAANRRASRKAATAEWSEKPYRFVEIRSRLYQEAMIVPIVSSERRPFFPVGFLPRNAIVNYAFALYDAPPWNLALVASRLHLVWIATVCGKMKTDYRYSNTLGWNTFPVPPLSEGNKVELTRRAEDILLAREAHWPATIADLYDPEKMPDDLRGAHDRNDETLERIYIGRRFRNDTERLETLFAMYTEMTARKGNGKRGTGKGQMDE